MNNLNIYIESNPNPNSLKFVTNIMLVDEGIVKDYPDIQSAEDSPLAKKLFNFNYVKRVFIMSNFITITKSEKFSWEEIKLDLRDFIKKYIEEENEIISKTKKQSSVKSESKSNNIDEKIKNILEEYIKPAVEQDGGAIDFESFDNDWFELFSCPASVPPPPTKSKFDPFSNWYIICSTGPPGTN